MTTKTANPNELVWFSECESMAELGLLLDAVPPSVRGDLLDLALTERTVGPDSEMVTWVRMLLDAITVELSGHRLDSDVKIPRAVKDRLWLNFAEATDVAMAQVCVCDFIRILLLASKRSASYGGNTSNENGENQCRSNRLKQSDTA